MSDNKDKLKKNQELRQALDDLVGDNDKITVDKGEEISEIREEGQVQLYTDFNKLNNTAKEESRKIVESIMKFYLDLDIISKNEHVQYKRKLHEMNISSIMFQMQSSEYVCIKLLEEIDAGNANLKTFEVFSKLQDTMMKIVEVQQTVVSKMQDDWKKVRSDNDELKLFNTTEANTEDEGSDLRIKGSRKMVEIAQKLSKENGLDKLDEYKPSTDPREAYQEAKKNNEEADEHKIDEELF